jgi:phage recombination protein Bet
MSNEVNTQEQKKAPSVIDEMAARFNMDRRAFEATMRKTVMPSKDNVSDEEFVAFLSVAKEYNLNPLTKEIYAFPNRGGITPIVSVDGWAKMINSHPQSNGFTFKDIREGNELVAVECIIYRKDKEHPITVTEYMKECKGNSEPWKKWPARMLRHKSLIQCARYAFGFSGIYDPDEGERIKDVTPVENNKELEKAFLSNEEQQKIVANKAKALAEEKKASNGNSLDDLFAEPIENKETITPDGEVIEND